MTRSEKTTTDETTIPAPLGEQIKRVQGLAERPRTLTEWGTAIGDIVDSAGIDVGLESLCTTDRSPHEARFDGTSQHFVCVQDAFIVPSVVGDVDEVEISTESPISGERITATIADGEVETDPPDAVMSIGVADDASEPPADADARELSYGKICPYGHAFVDRGEYHEWAETVDAVTMAAPLGAAFELASAIGEATT